MPLFRMNLELGQAPGPHNDLVERFSWVMLVFVPRTVVLPIVFLGGRLFKLGVGTPVRTLAALLPQGYR